MNCSNNFRIIPIYSVSPAMRFMFFFSAQKSTYPLRDFENFFISIASYQHVLAYSGIPPSAYKASNIISSFSYLSIIVPPQTLRFLAYRKCLL